ncbi:peptide-methionine (S)-S-oxide reductase [Mycoplasmopsis anatis]|nr:peptide-methionine (S)-S-oxide reductase [Mycoplasmopsis anatis]VEU73988.1 peptide-methionine (S)-S-oxide reductase [Mycoplasmopsis anatis]
MKKIYLGGGCFWGVQAYFNTIKGIINSTVGYANSKIDNPSYEQVKSQQTEAVEAVEIFYDESVISLKEITHKLLEVIDPTELNKQGEDIGTQYRNGIYFIDNDDEKSIKEVIQEVSKKFDKPLATEVLKLENYFLAEEYHQDYLEKNKGAYCHIEFQDVEKPKLELAEQNETEEILSLAKKKPYHNFFVIGDIEQFGILSDTTKTYVIRKNNSIKAIAFIFLRTLILVDEELLISEKQIAQLIKNNNIKNVIYQEENVKTIINTLDLLNLSAKNSKEELLILQKPSWTKEYGLLSRAAEREEIKLIIEGRKEIKEFATVDESQTSVETMTKQFDQQFYVPFIVRECDKIISHAAVTCSTENAAMIGGVYTLNEYRNRGYAKDSLINLCNWIIKNNKTPILFFDNPDAGKLYYSLGFEKIGEIFVSFIRKD